MRGGNHFLCKCLKNHLWMRQLQLLKKTVSGLKILELWKLNWYKLNRLQMTGICPEAPRQLPAMDSTRACCKSPFLPPVLSKELVCKSHPIFKAYFQLKWNLSRKGGYFYSAQQLLVTMTTGLVKCNKASLCYRKHKREPLKSKRKAIIIGAGRAKKCCHHHMVPFSLESRLGEGFATFPTQEQWRFDMGGNSVITGMTFPTQCGLFQLIYESRK